VWAAKDRSFMTRHVVPVLVPFVRRRRSTAKPRVAKRTLGHRARIASQPRRGCTSPRSTRGAVQPLRGCRATSEPKPQGALRDPGLRCETASRLGEQKPPAFLADPRAFPPPVLAAHTPCAATGGRHTACACYNSFNLFVSAPLARMMARAARPGVPDEEGAAEEQLFGLPRGSPIFPAGRLGPSPSYFPAAPKRRGCQQRAPLRNEAGTGRCG